ncbi:MAG TPA: biotin carboxylase N-terminal domain-containing protein [Vicinamibacterales bacterium]|nr:biotin carboxylase N-terminal domain-containing protein [Vicinamibacterales bacterium]
MFQRLLIANRGEIAVRIIRACREMGIESVAVYSDADRAALHVTLADRAVRIGPPPSAESYLSINAIIEAARSSGAQAVHPGYGFLSENQDLASACAAAGLTFVGPPPEVIAQMGSKIVARRLAEQAGVPVVPGETPADQSDAAIVAAATRIGFPVLIKPSEGGGGIGMKEVYDAAALVDAIAQARREATAAFGDGTLYVERLIGAPRHVEFQVLSDHHGHVTHVFERECSIQRRHQKVIEETPSTAVTPALRARMGAAAVAVAKAAGYRNAGTVEFLVDGSGDKAGFYFLEMNTRLQVEHPVTEQVAGIDLVRAQLLVAAGEPLPWTQEQLDQRGHAIEARIYAEDPITHLPQAGPVLLYREPSMPGVRVDSGIIEGAEVSVHYDPLLAKLIAWGEHREIARRRAIVALRAFPILGIRTNIPMLIELLEHPRFVAGTLDTRLMDTEGSALAGKLAGEPPPEVQAVAVAARSTDGQNSVETTRSGIDPWTSLGSVRV